MRPETISIEVRAARFARAVLLLLRGGAWTQADHEQWKTLTGQSPGRAKSVIEDMARRIIEETNGKETADRSE